MTPADQHASMILSLIGLGALTLGTLAMILRAVRQWLINRQTTAADVAAQFVGDVKRGEGFTFHKGRPPIMSSVPTGAARTADTTAVPVPVPGTSTATEEPAWQLPRVSRRLSDRELLILLAAQIGKDNKPRFSANALHTLLGGNRSEVLALIREARGELPTELIGDMIERVNREVAAEQH